MKVNISKWFFRKRRLINELRVHNRKLSETKMVLNQRERIMLLDALICDEYKGKVREPKTPRFIRIVYRGLLAKFKANIKEGV